MSAPKGYPSQTKLERVGPAFCTVEPVLLQQYALSVLAHLFCYSVGTDTAETGSTVASIVATAHAAQKGDVIRFTGGALSGVEVRVHSTSANAIVPVQDLASAPANTDPFQILRQKVPTVTAAGLVQVDALPAGTALIGKVDPNTLDVVDFIDTNAVLDASSTNVPALASNPTAIVATLAAAVKKVGVHSTIAGYVGLYTGAALSEVLQCVIPPSFIGEIPVQMAAAERVSFRNVETAGAAINAGKLMINFLG